MSADHDPRPEVPAPTDRPPLYGLIAEFENPGDLIAAARRAREEGYRAMDAYSPYPIHELTEALALPRTKLPLLVFIGGALGCGTALLMQWFATAVHYPINVGGRPLASWPSFIPITFELTVLFAAGTAVLGMLGLNGLPMPYHPIFNAARFALASRDRFFLCIEARDPMFDAEKTSRFLATLGARVVSEVDE
jgi:ActD protein